MIELRVDVIHQLLESLGVGAQSFEDLLFSSGAMVQGFLDNFPTLPCRWAMSRIKMPVGHRLQKLKRLDVGAQVTIRRVNEHGRKSRNEIADDHRLVIGRRLERVSDLVRGTTRTVVSSIRRFYYLSGVVVCVASSKLLLVRDPTRSPKRVVSGVDSWVLGSGVKRIAWLDGRDLYRLTGPSRGSTKRVAREVTKAEWSGSTLRYKVKGESRWRKAR